MTKQNAVPLPGAGRRAAAWCKQAFALAFTLGFAWVFAQVIFANPYYDHYQWYIILPLAAAWLAAFALLWRLTGRFAASMQAHTLLWLLGFFALLSLTQFAVYQVCAGYPVRDLERVFTGAYNYTIAGKIEDPYLDYFYKYPNNLPLTVVLQFLFRAVYRLGCTRFFVVAAVFNALCVQLGYLFTFLAARELKDTRTGFCSLAVLYLCLPLQVLVSFFYTDTTTLLYPPLVVYLGLRIARGKSKKRLAACLAALGLAVGFGAKLKYSVLLAAIALGIALLLRGQWKRLLAAAAALAVGFALWSAVFNGFIYAHILDKTQAEDRATPFVAWIAMGLQGDGTHNADDNYYIWAQETHEEKVDAALYQLTARLQEMGPLGYLRFLNHKILRSYASGDLDYPNTAGLSPMKQNSSSDYLNTGGSHYIAFDRVIQGYHVALFLLLILGGALAFLRKDHTWFLPQLAGFGLFVFLLLWEAGTRYLANYYPIYVLCALPGLAALADALPRRRPHPKQKGTTAHEV